LHQPAQPLFEPQKSLKNSTPELFVRVQILLAGRAEMRARQQEMGARGEEMFARQQEMAALGKELFAPPQEFGRASCVIAGAPPAKGLVVREIFHTGPPNVHPCQFIRRLLVGFCIFSPHGCGGVLSILLMIPCCGHARIFVRNERYFLILPLQAGSRQAGDNGRC
jgi:hypothetical protein